MQHEDHGEPDRPELAYDHLQRACRLLEEKGEHAIAAMVSHCMAMVHDRFGVGTDHLDDPGLR